MSKLVKRYPNATSNAVDELSFTVATGETFALLGPNGAGKTTTVAVLTTRARPTSGVALVGGVDVARAPVAARRKIGVVPQVNNLDRSLSIRDNLIFHAAYHGVGRRSRRTRARTLLGEFALLDRATEKPSYFSGGQAQRIMLARAMMHDPEVLFLDEPTAGLDPAARLFVWDRLGELKARGVTIVLTTHDLDEAAELADRVAIVDHGSLLASGTPEALMRSVKGKSTIELIMDRTPPAELVGVLGAFDGVDHVELPALSAGDGRGPRLRLYLDVDVATVLPKALGALGDAGVAVRDIHLGAPTLEDVFIDLTGRALR